MANNCKTFYLVQSGDSCSGILATYGITSSQFYTGIRPWEVLAHLFVYQYMSVLVLLLKIREILQKQHLLVGMELWLRYQPRPGWQQTALAFIMSKLVMDCHYCFRKRHLPLGFLCIESSCRSILLHNMGCYLRLYKTTGSKAGTNTTAQKPTITAGNGISTPTPVQPGMVGN
jgi:hypothetical protein